MGRVKVVSKFVELVVVAAVLILFTRCDIEENNSRKEMNSFVLRHSNEYLDEFYRIDIFMSQHELPESLNDVSMSISSIIDIVRGLTSQDKKVFSRDEIMMAFDNLNQFAGDRKLDFGVDVGLPDAISYSKQEFDFVVKLIGYKVWVRLLEPIDIGSVHSAKTHIEK